MAKSAAERKAAQRARLAEAGNRKLELILDAQELEMLEQNCAARRPGRAPYEMGGVHRVTNSAGQRPGSRSHQVCGQAPVR